MRTRGGAGRLVRKGAFGALMVLGVAGRVLGQSAGMGADPTLGSATDQAQAIHLLSRATWGVRPGDVEQVRALGADGWLERQLNPKTMPDELMDTRLTLFPTTQLSMSELYVDFSPMPGQRQEQQRLQMLRDSLGDDAPQVRELQAELRQQQQARAPARLLQDLVGAKIQRAVYSERQLEDVMTDFWFNHFNVYFNKGQDRYLVADYEKNAIRPHVFGRFEDMVTATAQHPAMLFYLDNWQSVWNDPDRQQAGPNLDQLQRRIATMTTEQKEQLVRSGRLTEEQLAALERGQTPVQRVAQNARDRGLNENYARELMELHTLGVDGGYTQQDVIEVARAFTGWTFRPYNARQQQMQDMADPSMVPQGPRGRGLGPGGAGAGTRGRGIAPAQGRGVGARAMAGRGARGRGAAGRAGGTQPEPFVGPGEVPFIFRPGEHDPGEKTVLGTTLPGGRGMEDGLEVIRMLSRHPSTARFIATKLVERFVSDDPPADLVDHLADVFLKTDGDLKEVTRALFTAEAFYRPEYRRAKVKTPYELVVSALRVTNATVGPSQVVMNTLRTMGHLPYTEPAPTGFPAMSEDWVNTGAMLARMTFGLDLAAGRVAGARVDIPSLAPQAGADLHELLETLMPGSETASLAEKIGAELEAQAVPQRQRAGRVLGLALGSPEFQRR